jgi:signal transduction histidine kinase/DNA-binding NarL/FixJ family response regulator
MGLLEMRIPGTEMHVVTFVFSALEIVMFFYQLIFFISRPTDKSRLRYLILLFLLIVYNIVGGLLPDQNIDISVQLQNCISYSTGFLMAAYFPYYFYKGFDLKNLRFHTYYGWFIYLFIPYVLFVYLYYRTDDLEYAAKIAMSFPIVYSLILFYSITKSVIGKYKENKDKPDVMEMIGLYIAYSSWFGVPIVTYFQASQAYEYLCSNTGFFVMTVLFVRKTVHQQRYEYNKLQELNESLTEKVKERTRQLELSNEQKTNFFVNLAHETKTPLTLIQNYFDEYIAKLDDPEELADELKVVKNNIDKLSKDIINFFDLERFNKGLDVYSHRYVSNFSRILTDNLVLFKVYCSKKKIKLTEYIEPDLLIKAHPQALDRIINNLIENAVKFSPEEGSIEVKLQAHANEIHFSIKDKGIGISPELHNKLFEPYYQINNEKSNSQGMGLGLSIVKSIVDSLHGHIIIHSNPEQEPGTEIIITLEKHMSTDQELEIEYKVDDRPSFSFENYQVEEPVFTDTKQTILVVEDNLELLSYLLKKLSKKYNVYGSRNGAEALRKLKEMPIPQLIISDIMMDGMDGFKLAKIISDTERYNHIPFLFITAKSTQKDKLAGLNMGALDVIQKPFSMTELQYKVEAVLTSHSRQRKALLTQLASHSVKIMSDGPEEILIDGVEQKKIKFEHKCKLYNLTSQETEITKRLIEGITYKKIGEELYISEFTVKTHAQNIFKKVDVQNKLALIKKFEK